MPVESASVKRAATRTAGPGDSHGVVQGQLRVGQLPSPVRLCRHNAGTACCHVARVNFSGACSRDLREGAPRLSCSLLEAIRSYLLLYIRARFLPYLYLLSEPPYIRATSDLHAQAARPSHSYSHQQQCQEESPFFHSPRRRQGEGSGALLCYRLYGALLTPCRL